MTIRKTICLWKKDNFSGKKNNNTRHFDRVRKDYHSAERARFELAIPFWGTHAFQACLFSHSSIFPFGGANIGKSI